MPQQTENKERVLSAHWGKLAANTLEGNWDACLEEVHTLAGLIGARHFSHAVALQQRACLMHWALFAFLAPAHPGNNPHKGLEAMVELCLDPAYMTTIQLVCPWLMPHVAMAVLLCRRRGAMQEFVRLTQADTPRPSPHAMVNLVRALHEGGLSATTGIPVMREGLLVGDATAKQDTTVSLFHDASAWMAADRLLAPLLPAFTARVQAAIFEAYVRLHHHVHLPTLITALGLPAASAERWILDKLQGMKDVEGVVDQVSNCITVTRQPTSIYQRIIEKTKSLAFRSSLCATNLEKWELELERGRVGGPAK
jgi:translation initiation factor 3 subunit E